MRKCLKPEISPFLSYQRQRLYCELHLTCSLHKISINSFPHDKILGSSKLKAFTDNNINVTESLEFVLGKYDKIVGKGDNAGYQHFLLFPQCFQKASHTRSLKVMIV